MKFLFYIQYQKQLRLREARQFLLSREHRASDVVFVVGYESVSRDYLRQFGTTSMSEIQQMIANS